MRACMYACMHACCMQVSPCGCVSGCICLFRVSLVVYCAVFYFVLLSLIINYYFIWWLCIINIILRYYVGFDSIYMYIILYIIYMLMSLLYNALFICLLFRVMVIYY